MLAPGGNRAAAVPNLDQIVAAYDPADPDHFLMGIYQGRGRRANRSARHWWHYNPGSLEALLRSAGFRDARVCDYREGRCPDVELIDTRPGSLFMEAVR